jgi:hypothetical protein
MFLYVNGTKQSKEDKNLIICGEGIMRIDTRAFLVFLTVFLMFVFVNDRSAYAAKRFLRGTGDFT